VCGSPPIDSLPEGRGAWRGANTWAIWFGQGDWTGGVGPNLPPCPSNSKLSSIELAGDLTYNFNLTTTKGQESTLNMECSWARRAAKFLYMPSLLKEYPCCSISAVLVSSAHIASENARGRELNSVK